MKLDELLMDRNKLFKPGEILAKTVEVETLLHDLDNFVDTH
jgi:hypothetical protein